MELGYIFLKIMQFYVVKMAANGGCRFEINIKTENGKTQIISQKGCKLMHIWQMWCYANNHYVGLFYEYCSFIRHYWKKINILCELVTSQPQ